MYPAIERKYPERDYIKKREVPLISRKIDLLMLELSSNEIIAIEVKVTNWRKALKQASCYLLCADRAYVALWHDFIHRINPQAFDKEGIGLLEVNGKVIQRIEAKKSNSIQKGLRNRILEYTQWGESDVWKEN